MTRSRFGAGMVVSRAGEAEDEVSTAHRRNTGPTCGCSAPDGTCRVLKDTGRPTDTCARYGVAGWEGYLAVAHTRMATESAVTVLHSHPFVPSRDLCVVHNGSFSNYATVRRHLMAAGVAVRLGQRLGGGGPVPGPAARRGDDLEEATRWVMKEMDGFFTLVISTADEMSVVRDAFACKPAVVAETDGYVAVASEYRALAELPGIADGRGLRAPTRGGLHMESLSCDALGTRAVNRAAAGPAGGRRGRRARTPGAAQPGGRASVAGLRSPSTGTPATSSADWRGRRRHRARHRRQRLRRLVGGREPDGRLHPGARGSASQSAGSSARGGTHRHRGRRLVAGRDLPQGRHAGHRRRRGGDVGLHGPVRHSS